MSEINEFERNLAVVIGINDYQNGIDKLNTAVPDAVAIAEILRDTYQYTLINPDRDSQAIVDNYATKSKLEKLLTDILPNKIQPTESDRLLIYFAGHGIARSSDRGLEGYLVPQDGDINHPESLIRMGDLNQWLSELQCRHLLVILDCCFAGAFRWASTRKLIYLPQTIHWEHYYRFIKYPAWQVLTSAAYNQEALDFINNREIVTGKQHSPFAKALIKALGEGKADLVADGVITTPELYLYLREQVEKYSDERQTPGFFPLAKHDRGEYIFKLPNTEPKLEHAPKLDKENNPYRGLEPFEERHAPLFFGRDEVVEELFTKVVNLVQTNNQLTIVTGISGSGKSSLVKAGLIPKLNDEKDPEWYVIAAIKKDQNGKNRELREIMRPGKDPYLSLAKVLSSNVEQKNTPKIVKDPQWYIKRLEILINKNKNKRLLLIIDQFEELITMTPKVESVKKSTKKGWLQKRRETLGLVTEEPELDKSKQKSEQGKEFIKLLKRILDRYPQLSLVLTIRSDFEPRFKDSEFGKNWANARFVVRPMHSDELREAVERPAVEKALYFEPPELVDRLVDEVLYMPGALPLLSFTLSEMYIKLKLHEAGKEGKEDRALTISEDFHSEGGVAGMLTRRANEIFDRLPNDAYRLTMRRVMLRMVNLEDGISSSRRVIASELIYPSQEENNRRKYVLESLQKASLIMIGKEVKTDEIYYEPAHDFLVRDWDELKKWIDLEQKNENLALRKLLTPVAFDWSKDPNIENLWHKNSHLERLEEIVRSEESWLNKIEWEFIEKSINKKKNDKRQSIFISHTVVSIFLGILIPAIIYRIQFNREQKINFSSNLVTTSKFLKHSKSYFHETTVLLNLEAYKLAHRINEPSSEIDSALRNSLELLPHYAYPAFYGVSEIEFTSSGDLSLTNNDETTNLVELEAKTGDYSKSHLETINEQEINKSVDLIQHSKDYVAIFKNNNLVKAYQIDGWQEIDFIPENANKYPFNLKSDTKLIKIRLSPTKKYIVFFIEKECEDGQTEAHFNGCKVNEVKLFKMDSEEVVRDFEETNVEDIEFSHDDEYVAIKNSSFISDSHDIKLIQLNKDRELAKINHEEYVSDMAFSPDGRYLATASDDGTSKLVRVNTGEVISIISHGKCIDNNSCNSDLIFSPNSQYLATLSNNHSPINYENGTLKLVKLNTLKINPKFYFDNTKEIKFNLDRQYLALKDEDNEIKVYTFNQQQEKIQLNTNNINDIQETTLNLNSQHLLLQEKMEKCYGYGYEDTEQCNGKYKYIIDHGFSPDGKYLAIRIGKDSYAINSNITKIIEVNTEKEIADFYYQEGIDDVLFSHDGSYLAILIDAQSKTKTVKIIDIKTGKEITDLYYQEGIERDGVIFSPNEDYLLVVSDGKEDTIGSVKINLLDPDRIVKKTCERLSENLNFQLWQRYFDNKPYPRTCPNLPIHPSVLQEAERLAKAGNIKEAISIYKRAKELEPNDYNNRGKLLQYGIDLNPRTETIDRNPKKVANTIKDLED